MNEIDKFAETLSVREKKNRELLPAALVWATVKSVDWSAKTMTATGQVDGLDYFKVKLGLGNLYRRPAVGSKVLLGILEKQESAAILVDAETVEELIYKSGASEFTIKEQGYIVKKGNESLKNILNDFIDEVNKIIVVNGTTINVGAVTAIKQRLNTVLTA
jgi:hypothetical protein